MSCLCMTRDLRETSVKRLNRRDLGRLDGDRRHVSAWSDAQSRAGLRAMKLGASRETPMDGGFPAVLTRFSLRQTTPSNPFRRDGTGDVSLSRRFSLRGSS
jgi:hypothetical protein